MLAAVSSRSVVPTLRVLAAVSSRSVVPTLRVLAAVSSRSVVPTLRVLAAVSSRSVVPTIGCWQQCLPGPWYRRLECWQQCLPGPWYRRLECWQQCLPGPWYRRLECWQQCLPGPWYRRLAHIKGVFSFIVLLSPCPITATSQPVRFVLIARRNQLVCIAYLATLCQQSTFVLDLSALLSAVSGTQNTQHDQSGGPTHSTISLVVQHTA